MHLSDSGVQICGVELYDGKIRLELLNKRRGWCSLTTPVGKATRPVARMKERDGIGDY
jgi:hypothetical protein